MPSLPNRCVLLLVDGLRPDLGEAMLQAGELPNLGAMIAEGGRNRAITVFPSTTSVAYLPFLTGCTPGQCNIPSIRWLDRRAYGGHWWRDRAAVRSYCGFQAPLLDRDIASHVRTIFELVPESMGIFTPIARGLAPARDPSRVERQFWGSMAHFVQWHQPSDDAVSRHLLKALDGRWRFVFAQFPAVDGYTHQTTPDATPVRRALRRVDETVGAVRARLRERGELETTLMLVVSDHGATSVHTHVDLAAWFRRHDIPTLSHPVIWERNPRAAVMVAGNGSAMVYARPDDRRERRWPIERLRRPEGFGVPGDVVAALRAEPAVAFVAAESADGGLWVGSGSGSARIVAANGIVTYTPIDGDPLAVGGARAATQREWLDATWDSAYPDVTFHLLDQFRADRTGDLIVVAREGYDFREHYEVPEHKAGHGSLIRAHMQTPVWASQPVPAVALRTVDLFPAMLDWLEVDVPAGIDGEPVWLPRSRLRNDPERTSFPVPQSRIRSTIL
ncbi:MAG: alkaline phosphatase family protein [Gemmatimonadales bacterium]